MQEIQLEDGTTVYRRGRDLRAHSLRSFGVRATRQYCTISFDLYTPHSDRPALACVYNYRMRMLLTNPPTDTTEVIVLSETLRI